MYPYILVPSPHSKHRPLSLNPIIPHAPRSQLNILHSCHFLVHRLFFTPSCTHNNANMNSVILPVTARSSLSLPSVGSSSPPSHIPSLSARRRTNSPPPFQVYKHLSPSSVHAYLARIATPPFLHAPTCLFGTLYCTLLIAADGS